MLWTEPDNVHSCREILLIKPYQFKSDSKESGANCKTVSIRKDLNTITELDVPTTQKLVKDKYCLLP